LEYQLNRSKSLTVVRDQNGGFSFERAFEKSGETATALSPEQAAPCSKVLKPGFEGWGREGYFIDRCRSEWKAFP
jgi:hypothetical protein